MLDASNLPVYFKNLHELSDRATQFPWKPRAESDCAELAAELYRMIEQWEKKANKEPVFEHFCREMLAECFPGNAAYYMSPVCSRDTEIYGQARFVYTALLVVNLPYKTAGAISAALVACAAIGVASRKTLKKLEGDATQRLLPPSLPFGSARAAQLLLAKMPPKKRLRLVAGTDAQ